MKIKTLLCILTTLFILGCAQQNIENTTTQTEQIPKIEKTKSILALGDSLTEGYNLPIEESYPYQLQELLEKEGFSEYKVINAGVSGETSTGTRERIDWVLKQNPDIVILSIGSNDAIRGIDIEIIRDNLEYLIQTIQEKDAQVILAGMEIYDNIGQKYQEEFINLYPKMSEKYNIPLIEKFLNNVAGVQELNLNDQIHPNKAGYKIIVEENIWPVLKKQLVESRA